LLKGLLLSLLLPPFCGPAFAVLLENLSGVFIADAMSADVIFGVAPGAFHNPPLRLQGRCQVKYLPML
jgi:hypothetical protein